MQATKRLSITKPDLLLWLLAGVAVLSLVGFGAYYYYDRYVHPNVKVLDRQAQQVEDMVKKDPQNPDLRVGVASYYLDVGLVDQAIDQAKQALVIKADYPGALIVLGQAYQKKGDQSTALTNYKRAIELTKDAPMANLDTRLEAAYYQVGTIYIDQKKYADAVDTLKQALAINHTDADAIFSLGLAYQGQGDHQNAIKQFQDALRFDPTYVEPYKAMVTSYNALGQGAGVAYAQAMITLIDGKNSEAATQLEAVIKQSPDIGQAYYGLGLAYEQLGKFDQAQTALKTYTEKFPDDMAGAEALARVTKEASK